MVYLMSVERFKNDSFIDTNVNDKTIKLSIKLAQDQIIEPILGTKLYNKLLTGIVNADLELPYQGLLVDYIWPVLVAATEVIAYKKILYRITNSSIVKDGNTNSMAIDIGELQGLIRDNEVFMQPYIKKLQDYLLFNAATFPEYYEYEEGGKISQPGQNAISFYYDGPELSNYGPSSRN